MKRFLQTPLGEFLRLSQPFTLIQVVFFYSLGAGVIVYRGQPVDWPVFWMGLMCALLLQLSAVYLNAFYARLQIPRRRKPDDPRNNLNDQENSSRNAFLLAAITTLTISAMLTVLLNARGVFSLPSALILGLSLALVFAYAVPPFRLIYSGYGELVQGLFLTILIPALGYLLQNANLFQALGMFTFPLMALYLAMTLALSLETYYSEIKAGRQNLMIRLGWQRGMTLHNLLVFFAFLLIGLGPLTNFSWSLTWPRLLTLPIGLFQVWQIWQIGNGARTQWRLLRVTALATFGISLYLTVFMLWLG